MSFSLSAGKWSIPATTGCRPSPCATFSFTAISDHRAVQFGGKQPGGRVSDCYVVDFKTMVCTEVFCTNSSVEVYVTHATVEMSAHSVGGRSCPSDTVLTINNVHFTTAIILQAVFRTHNQFVFILHHLSQEWNKLERQEGAPRPVERSCHAACCLNYGQHHPQVLVSGGWDKNGNTLNDMWILDVKSGIWREVRDDVHVNVWLVQSEYYLSLQFYSIWTSQS